MRVQRPDPSSLLDSGSKHRESATSREGTRGQGSKAGAYSHQTLWENLQRGEIADPKRSLDEERELMTEEGPLPGGSEPTEQDPFGGGGEPQPEG